MASKPNAALPVRGRVPGGLERVADKQWKRLQRIAQALRSMAGAAVAAGPRRSALAAVGVHSPCAMACCGGQRTCKFGGDSVARRGPGMDLPASR